MTALNAVGFSAAIQPATINPPSNSAAQSGDGSSFHSMLQQNATEATQDNSADSTSNQTSNQAQHKRDSDPATAAAAAAGQQPATPADNLPLPTRLSFNLFGLKSDVAKAGNKEDRTAEKKQNETAISLVPQAIATLPQDVLAGASKAGAGIDANNASANQGDLQIETEDKPNTPAPPPTLAFALRLTPSDEHANAPLAGQAKTADSQAATTVGAAESIQAQRAGADSTLDNHHSGNQSSDADTSGNALPAATLTTSESSYQAIHMATAEPQPASAPAPAETTPQTPQIATHAPTAMHTDAPARTGTASELSLSVSAPDQQKVEVRVMDRAGEVRVSVRTPNEELASTLRTDLGSLTGKLNQSGFATEAFAPSSHSGGFSRDQSNTPSDQQQNGGQDRNFGRQNQEQDSQQGGRERRPAWVDEFENSMANGPVRKDAR